jgi:hypothetical protein
MGEVLRQCAFTARELGEHANYLEAWPYRRLRARDKRATETDCVAGHVRFELRNVAANYLFERWHRFAGIQSNPGQRDYSRLSCGAGDTQLRAGSAGIFSERSARTLALVGRRREGTNWPRLFPIQR